MKFEELDPMLAAPARVAILATLADETPAPHDSLWYQGHAYRQWMYDQNSIGDENSNLDPELLFLRDGKVRAHPGRVYFYTNIDGAIQIARETRMPLAFYIFDHHCRDCLNQLPLIYEDPLVVEKSHGFVNVYIETPKRIKEIIPYGISGESLTAQFFTPGMRRLRMLSGVEKESLLEVYDLILNYVEKMDEEVLLERFEPKAREMDQNRYR